MKKNSRETILEIARSLFPKFGYNGISIRSIASRAKLTTGAVYFHFKNKKEIYSAICREAVDILISMLRTKMAERTSPNQKLIATFDAYLEFFYKHPEYYNILMEAKADYGLDDGSPPAHAESIKEIIDVGMEPIRLGIESGLFRDVDARKLSIFLAALTEGMIQYKKLGILDRLEINDSDFRKFMADIVGNGIAKVQS